VISSGSDLQEIEPSIKCSYKNVVFQKHCIYQTQTLANIEANPSLADHYIVALHIYGQGLSDWSNCICDYFTGYNSWPSQILWFSNHSSINFLKSLEWITWEKYAHLFEHFVARSEMRPGDDIQYRALKTVKKNLIEENGRGICDGEIWRDFMIPRDDIQERVEMLKDDTSYTVGLHIRTYWLLEHDVWYYNPNHIMAQDLLDCALSLNLNTTKTARYFVASDSYKVKNLVQTFPNFFTNLHKPWHSGGEVCDASFESIVDYFMIYGSDFIVHSPGSSWKWISKHGNKEHLIFKQKPTWCEKNNLELPTFQADIG